MNDVNLAPENKEATPEHGYLMAYDKKEQKAKGVKGIAANGELETLEANEANRDQFIKVDQRGNFFTNFGKNFLYQYNNPGRYSLYNMPKETLVEQAKEKIEAAQEPQNEAVRRELASLQRAGSELGTGRQIRHYPGRTEERKGQPRKNVAGKDFRYRFPCGKKFRAGA